MKNTYIYSVPSLLQIYTPYLCHIGLKISSLTAVTKCRLELQPVVTKIPKCEVNRQKLTQLSPRSHPRHLVGKSTAQKDTMIDTTSDSQVNSNFPHRWSPASLTFNNYFYLFLYLYLTRITLNNCNFGIVP